MMNRRANIQEKDIRSFTPQAVGVPKEDKSGQIIAAGAQDLAAGLMVRQEKADKLAATARLGDFTAEYTKGKSELQKQFSKDPQGYIGAAQELGEELKAKHSKDLSSGQARQFNEAATIALAQDRDNVVDWSIKQDQEIIVGNALKSHQDLELSAEAALTPDSLNDVLARLETVNSDSSAFISPTSNAELKKKTRKSIIDNSMNARMLENPNTLYGELYQGTYDSYLTPLEVKSYLDKSHDAMINYNYREQYKSLKTMAITVSGATDQVILGKASPGEISRLADLYELHKNDKDAQGNLVYPPEIVDAFKRLKEMAVRQSPKSATQKSIDAGAFLAKFDADWDTFMLEGGSKATPKHAAEEIKMYARLLEAVDTGVITPAQFETKKKILDAKVKTRLGKKTKGMTLEEAFNKTGRVSWNPAYNGDDLYSEGYSIIRDRVEKQDLPAAEKRRQLDLYFLMYTKEIDRMPPAVTEEIEDYKAAAHKILLGDGRTDVGFFNRVATYPHPERPNEALVYGQTTMLGGVPAVFAGVNPQTGKFLWRIKKKIVDGLENQ